jgi:uncharacterized protein (TIGR02001 family)
MTVLSGPTHAADVTGNIGWNSDYIFRGVQLSSSSANGGLDVTHGNWYAGTWLADVETENLDGIEIDLYGGWSGQTGEWSYGIGGTGYFYTDGFDSDYYELNLSGGYKIFTLDIAIGKYDTTPSLDYTFISGTIANAGFYGTVGLWTQDFEGWYIELGYGDTLNIQDTEIFDWKFSFINSNDIELVSGPLADDTSIVLGFTRAFDLFKK